MQTDKDTLATLEKVRKALLEVDHKRSAKDLDEDEREDLELSAVALRDAERLLISATQKSVVKDFESISDELKKMSVKIRDRVRRLNRTAKILDKAETILKDVLRIISALGQWMK